MIAQIDRMFLTLKPLFFAGVSYFEFEYSTFTRLKSCGPGHKPNLRSARGGSKRHLGRNPCHVLRGKVCWNLENNNAIRPRDAEKLIDVTNCVHRFHMLKHEIAVNKIKAAIGKHGEVAMGIVAVFNVLAALVELPC